MSKKAKQLIIAAAVVVVLGVAAIFLTLTPTNSSDASSATSSTETINVLEKSTDDVFVSTIDIKNETDEFTVEFIEGDYSDTYEIKELEDDNLPALHSDIITLGKSFAPLTAYRKLEEVGSDKDYGLDKPQATITVNYSNKTSVTLEVGNELQSFYYIRKQGEKEIYLAQLNEGVFKGLTQFVSLEILNEVKYDENGQEAPLDFGVIEISGGVNPEKIVIRPTTSTDKSDPLYGSDFYMETPGRYRLYGNAQEQFFPYFQKLAATEAVVVSPTQEELEEYGFGENKTSLYFTMNNGEYQLYAGNVEKNGVYVMIDDTNIIYKAKANEVPWATMDAFDLREPLVYLPRITAVHQVAVTVDGKEYVFERERKVKESDDKETSSDKEEQVEYDYTVYYDNKVIDTNDFSKFYQTIISVTTESILPEEFELGDTSDIKVVYSYYDEFNRMPTTIELFDVGSRRAVFSLNGEPDCLVNFDNISAIAKHLQKIISE